MSQRRLVPAITASTFRTIVTPWLTGMEKNDIVAVVSYPGSDRQRRLLNLTTNTDTITPKPETGFIFVSVDFRVDPIDTVLDLESAILIRLREQTGWRSGKNQSFTSALANFKKAKNKKIALMAIGAERLLEFKRTSFLIWFVSMCRVKALSMTLFFETNIFLPDNIRQLGCVSAFQPRLHFLRLYDSVDAMQFIKRMTQYEWSFNLTPEMEEFILDQCGGYLLLLKEALWYLRDHPRAQKTEVLNHTEMLFNLDILWNGFTETDRQVMIELVKVGYCDHSDHASSIKYLLQTGIIIENKHQFDFSVPLFKRYINSAVLSASPLNLDSNNRICIGITPVEASLSKTERVITRLLLSKPDEIILREELGRIIAGPKGTYSDWALDSQLSRLRRKLHGLGIPDESLVTLKKRGIMFKTKTSL